MISPNAWAKAIIQKYGQRKMVAVKAPRPHVLIPSIPVTPQGSRDATPTRPRSKTARPFRKLLPPTPSTEEPASPESDEEEFVDDEEEEEVDEEQELDDDEGTYIKSTSTGCW